MTFPSVSPSSHRAGSTCWLRPLGPNGAIPASSTKRSNAVFGGIHATLFPDEAHHYGGRPSTFEATVALAEKAQLTFAQFVLLTRFPARSISRSGRRNEGVRADPIDGVPITRHWLIAAARRPTLYTSHPTMSVEEIRLGAQAAWDRFYSWPAVWRRSGVVRSVRGRLAFVLVSKLYRQMYANTGIATASARVARSVRRTRGIGKACRRLFLGSPMPNLQLPG